MTSYCDGYYTVPQAEMQGAALVDGVSQNDSVAESRKQPVLDRLRNNIGTLHEVINIAGNIIGPEECAVVQNHYGEADHIREMEGLDLPLTDITERDFKCGMPGKACDKNMDP